MRFKVYFDDETAQRLTAAPKAMTEKFAAIAALTDAFCAQPLDAELRRMILLVVRACGGAGERFACGSRGGFE